MYDQKSLNTILAKVADGEGKDSSEYKKAAVEDPLVEFRHRKVNSGREGVNSPLGDGLGEHGFAGAGGAVEEDPLGGLQKTREELRPLHRSHQIQL